MIILLDVLGAAVVIRQVFLHIVTYQGLKADNKCLRQNWKEDVANKARSAKEHRAVDVYTRYLSSIGALMCNKSLDIAIQPTLDAFAHSSRPNAVAQFCA